MTREIKFRAWDKKMKVMLQPVCDGLMIHLDGELNSFDVDGEIAGTANTRQVELLQFIGRKDKNKVDIYDGDLVKSGKRVMEVFWNNIGSGGWWFAEKKDGYRKYVDKIDLDTLEVIGNIYENPELLGEA